MGHLKRGIGRTTLLVALCLAFVGALTVAQVKYAPVALAATIPYIVPGYGDPHDCYQLAYDATNPQSNYTDGTPIPVIPNYNSQPNPFTWHDPGHAQDSIVACQSSTTATWDGYGNPFQCEELVQRYAALRWGDNPLPLSAGGDWAAGAANTWPDGNHPGHLKRHDNKGPYQPEPGGRHPGMAHLEWQF